MNNTVPTFAKQDGMKFFRTLNSKVNNYFKENNIEKTGNWKLYLKTIILFSIFITPYILIITLTNMPFWVFTLLSILIGIGMAGIGMNVMHDGNHGSYSNKGWVNKFMGGTIYVLAGNVYNWQVQHNVLHHTYTNIPGHDEDLDAGRIIRFTKEAKNEANRDGVTPIELIDGDRLVELFEKHNLGLKPVVVFEIDFEFFKSFS